MLCAGNMMSNISFYTAIAGYAGANKSKAVDILRDACHDIDLALGNKLEDSRVNSSAIIETVFAEVQRVGHTINILFFE
ncbi:unnamed protein product [Didymodactylos carnosus]|uniref:Uncharacterized protein n=1 Tax=Didymodactylos carnosus TaxID=1234261 RepID=A0A815JD25_9BILA|nr:unnamed protein product [Didymodactylos carnosus]CAF4266807.1 unnamed protein product [Didymodactylos carnosus]